MLGPRRGYQDICRRRGELGADGAVPSIFKLPDHGSSNELISRGRSLIFEAMKRLLLAAMLISSMPLLAQEAGAPVSAAARQESAREAAERFSRLEADIEQLKADNISLRDEVSKLRQELSKVRDEQVKTATTVANAYNPHEDLKHLAEKITEVDRKRESDKAAISEEVKHSISKLESAISAAAAVRPAPRAAEKPAPAPVDIPDTGFSYTVAQGDSLGAIVQAYNKEFKSKGLKTITLAQVKAANPAVNWDKMKPGMKIVIPQPAPAKE